MDNVSPGESIRTSFYHQSLFPHQIFHSVSKCVCFVCVCVTKVPRRPSSQHGATLSAALQEGLHHDALQRLDAMSNYM